MRTGTIVSLGASAVLGLGALVVARIMLPQPGHGLSAKSPAAAVDTVAVVVARSDIPYGAKIDASRLAVEQLPRAAAPKGAYATTTQILSSQGGPPIALTPIAAREPVLPDKLSTGGVRPILSAVIDEGMRAYTIGVTDVADVGGHVLPGDHVDVVLTRSFPVTPKPGGPSCGDCKLYVSNIVLQDVRVLGLDLNVDPTSTQSAVAHTATLEVDIQDAEKLAAASQAGALSLALRRTGSGDVIPVRAVFVHDFSVPDPLAHASAPSAAEKHAGSAAPAERTRSVVVVNGDSATSAEVPSDRIGAGA